MVNEKDLKKLLENHPEISSLCQLVGKRYVLNGFSDEETVVLSTYLYELLEVAKYKGYRSDDTLKIYEYLGGSLKNYPGSIESAERNGYVNLGVLDNGEEFPSLSSKMGIKKVYELIKRSTGRELRIFKAGEQYAAKIKFEQFLEEEVLPSNELFIVDSYISPDTLKFLSKTLGKLKKTRILTYNISEFKKFQEDLDAFKTQGKMEIELRKAKIIHDRFIISDKQAWSIGSSIKDLGNKDSIISDQFSIRDTLLELLNDRWASSETIDSDSADL
jgi:hypothetical protein